MALAPDPYYALLEVFVFLALAELVQSIARKIALPAIASYLLLGMLLSGFALGGVIDRLSGVEIFTANNIYVILFADFSVVLLLFAAGLGSGFQGLREAGLPAILAAVAGDLAPFAVTVLVVSRFEPFEVALLLGVAVAPTSAAVVASLRDSERVGASSGSRFLLNAAALDDVVALLLLSAVLTAVGGQFDVVAVTGSIFESVLAWVILLLAAVLVVPLVFRVPALRENRGMPFLILFVLVAIVLPLGFSAVIGAFIAGLAVAESLAASKTREVTEFLLLVFGALFFVVVGAEFDTRLLGNPSVLAVGALLAALAIGGKFLGVYPFARWKLKDDRTARAVATGMLPRGEIGLLVGTIGVTRGIFDQALLGDGVLLSLLTTILGSLAFRRLAPALRSPGTS